MSCLIGLFCGNLFWKCLFWHVWARDAISQPRCNFSKVSALDIFISHLSSKLTVEKTNEQNTYRSLLQKSPIKETIFCNFSKVSAEDICYSQLSSKLTVGGKKMSTARSAVGYARFIVYSQFSRKLFQSQSIQSQLYSHCLQSTLQSFDCRHDIVYSLQSLSTVNDCRPWL